MIIIQPSIQQKHSFQMHSISKSHSFPHSHLGCVSSGSYGMLPICRSTSGQQHLRALISSRCLKAKWSSKINLRSETPAAWNAKADTFSMERNGRHLQHGTQSKTPAAWNASEGLILPHLNYRLKEKIKFVDQSNATKIKISQ